MRNSIVRIEKIELTNFKNVENGIIEFKGNSDKNEEYKALTKNGTTNASNVKARYDYWNKIVK